MKNRLYFFFLAWFFEAGLCGAGFACFGGAALAACFPFARAIGLVSAGAGVASFPFFFPFSSLVTAAFAGAAGSALASAFLPRFTGGGGGGGGGGGSKGFKNLMVSVRERSLPSSRSMKTSSASLG